jgi:hypothetical protein
MRWRLRDTRRRGRPEPLPAEGRTALHSRNTYTTGECHGVVDRRSRRRVNMPSGSQVGFPYRTTFRPLRDDSQWLIGLRHIASVIGQALGRDHRISQ